MRRSLIFFSFMYFLVFVEGETVKNSKKILRKTRMNASSKLNRLMMPNTHLWETSALGIVSTLLPELRWFQFQCLWKKPSVKWLNLTVMG